MSAAEGAAVDWPPLSDETCARVAALLTLVKARPEDARAEAEPVVVNQAKTIEGGDDR
jgi:hypothetical protein